MEHLPKFPPQVAFQFFLVQWLYQNQSWSLTLFLTNTQKNVLAEARFDSYLRIILREKLNGYKDIMISIYTVFNKHEKPVGWKTQQGQICV